MDPHARFRATEDAVGLVEGMGFELQQASSALFWGPGKQSGGRASPRRGIEPEAGLVALRFGPRPAHA